MPAVDENTNAPLLLVIEDDQDLAGLLSLHLGDQGYRVVIAGDGPAGLELLRVNAAALVVLDIMLPGMDGFEVCRQIRAHDGSIPVMMLTARSEELDKVLGLELGADDYMTKPFSIRELVARVRALLRRAEQNGSSAVLAEGVLDHGDLQVDLRRRRVSLAGQSIDLTTREFELLLLFARNPGIAFSRQELLDRVWGYQYGGYSHTVNSHINRLRSKLEADPANPRWIETVWGLGYRFRDTHDGDPA
ncbi:MAG: response regulator transcription factor [Calditrichaeota bacterium]|nr:response regulator transcription factor [Candidatus Cloacimonadota bacterium]MCB1047461.1 response regulator transcription factor [Calditrichota bacterium]